MNPYFLAIDQKFSKFETQIKAFLDANTPIINIINYFKKNPRSIYNAIYRVKKKIKNISQQERASSGRYPKLSSRDIRAINRDITRSPRKTKKRILQENNLKVSISTIKRVLKDQGWVINISKKKQILDKEKAKKRLYYVKKQLKELSNINFSKIIFSDECGIQRGHGSRTQFARNRPKYPKHRKIYSTKNTSKYIYIYYISI